MTPSLSCLLAASLPFKLTLELSVLAATYVQLASHAIITLRPVLFTNLLLRRWISYSMVRSNVGLPQTGVLFKLSEKEENLLLELQRRLYTLAHPS